MRVGEGNEAYGRKAFKRSGSHFADRIAADGRDRWPVEAGHYRGPCPPPRSWPRGSSLVRRHPSLKEADQMSKKKKKLPLAYQPLGFVLGWVSGALATAAFRRTWKVIRHEDDAPDALDRDRGWGEVLLAAAVQGAIFAVVRSAVDRTGAKVIERSTGVWPTAEKGGRD